MLTSITEGRAAQAALFQHARLDTLLSYRVELARDLFDEQGQLIDWLIGFAFDTLGACALDLRVVPSEQVRSVADLRPVTQHCNLLKNLIQA